MKRAQAAPSVVGTEPVHHREATDEPASAAVVDALATAEGVDPLDLSYQLYDSVDPDAMDTLVRDADDDWRFEFPVDDYHVTVRGDGSVTVHA